VAYKIRQLTPDDAAAAYRLGSIAFGYADRPAPPPSAPLPAGRRSWGAFTADDVLVAKAIDLEQSHWFGGRLVPATGVAGVAVAAEHRGHGLSTVLLTQLMADAHERGAVIGALFDTTPWPYRRVGWEEVGVRQTLALPTLSLAGMRIPAGLAVRAATEADVPAMLDMFREVARAGCGIMDRLGPRADTTPASVLAEYHGTSIAVDAGGVLQGFCSWDRAGSYRAGGTLTVDDLIALTPAALTALLAMLGGWAAVAPNLFITLPPQDPALLVSAMAGAPVHSREPWMLRVIDVAEAVAARGWPPYVRGSIDLRIDDPVCPWNTGSFRLVLDDGVGRLEPGGTEAVMLGPRGLALLYAGAAGPDALRRAGLMTGGDASSDALLQAATAGPTPAIRDYF
jgi:predicted acetyltransferase